VNEQWIWPYPNGITDLTDHERTLGSAQLKSATQLWNQRRSELSKSKSLAEFTARLDRRFAIENNVIERVFTLDRGITEVLVEEGIKASLIPYGSTDKPPHYVVDILQSALDAQHWMIDRYITNSHPVTRGSIMELHHLLTQHQHTTDAQTPIGERIQVPLLHGQFKKTDNQVRKEDSVLRYCPPEHTDAQVDRLIDWHSDHVRDGIAPEVAAAWLHHRLTQIHPFQDGNGRVSRCLAGLVFLKAGLFPLIVTRDDQGKYIETLELADAGDLGPLVSFFVDNQLLRFDQALNLASDVQAEGAGTLGLAIESIGDALKKRESERLAAQKRLLSNAELVLESGLEFLQVTAQKLKLQGLDSYAVQNDQHNDFHYQGQAIGFAKAHGYYADFGSFRGWARLLFETKPATQFLLHFHARGRDLGVIVGAAILEIIEYSQEDGPAHREAIDIVLKPFEFYSTESLDQIQRRFKPWLEETLTLALAQVAKFI